ncbi:MAG: hypothetical protein ACYDA2_07180 [Acidimicrobiales bacterium]
MTGDSGAGGADWRADPFGRHELRQFFLGEPTSLVRDGAVDGYDPVGRLVSSVPVERGAEDHAPPGRPAAAAPRWSPVDALRNVDAVGRKLPPAMVAILCGGAAIGLSVLVAVAFGAATAPPPLGATATGTSATRVVASTTTTSLAASRPLTASASGTPTTVPAPSVTAPVTTPASVPPPSPTTTTQPPCPRGAPQATVYMSTQPTGTSGQWAVTITGSATNSSSTTVRFDYASVQLSDPQGDPVALVDAAPSGGPAVLAPDQSVKLSYNGTVQSSSAPRVTSVTAVWDWTDPADSGCPT